MLMANLSDKLTILRGLHSIWKKPLTCDPPCCSETLLHSCGPVLLEWLQRATMAGCNTESFLSFVRDREEVEVSSYHFFKEARHWCQSFVGNFVVAIHRWQSPHSPISSCRFTGHSIPSSPQFIFSNHLSWYEFYLIICLRL